MKFMDILQIAIALVLFGGTILSFVPKFRPVQSLQFIRTVTYILIGYISAFTIIMIIAAILSTIFPV